MAILGFLQFVFVIFKKKLKYKKFIVSFFYDYLKYKVLTALNKTKITKFCKSVRN